MTIEERLEKLERKLNRAQFINRLLAVMGIGLLLTMWFFASGTPTAQKRVMDEIRAKRFIVEDENGVARAGLGVNDDMPSLVLFDKNGENIAGLGVIGDDTALSLHDKNGKARVALVVKDDGPGLVLFDKNGITRSVIGVNQTQMKDGKIITYPESSLILYGPDSTIIWQAP